MHWFYLPLGSFLYFACNELLVYHSSNIISLNNVWFFGNWEIKLIGNCYIQEATNMLLNCGIIMKLLIHVFVIWFKNQVLYIFFSNYTHLKLGFHHKITGLCICDMIPKANTLHNFSDTTHLINGKHYLHNFIITHLRSLSFFEKWMN